MCDFLVPLVNRFTCPMKICFVLGLRRRRQNTDKYVTDPSQLNLRFYRPKTRGIMR